MVLSLTKALLEERAVDLGRGVRLWIRPVGFARFSRMNAEAWIRARAELMSEVGDGAQGEAEPPPHAIAALSQAHLNRALIVETITRWEGLEDECGAVPEITPETWAVFADLYPDLASLAIAELLQPGLLAAAEGNGCAPSPNGAQAGARSTAGDAPSLPEIPATPAPATAARGPARRTSTRP